MKLKIRFGKRNRDLQLLLAVALLSEFAYLALAAVGDLRHQVPFFLFFYGFAFVLYLLAVVGFFGICPNQAGPWQSRAFRSLEKFIPQLDLKLNLSRKEIISVGILFGVLFRLTLLFTQPSLSDDIYRYIWDGKVAANGINPYRYEPESESLRSLRDAEIYPSVNHKEIATVYPPVSQLTFLGLYKIKGSVLVFKTGFLLFEALMVVVTALILKSLQLNQTRLLIYLWNPLPIVEIAGSGHADIIGIFFLVLSLLLLVRRKLIGSSIVLTFSFLTKFIAVILLPVLTLVKKRTRIIIPLVFIIAAGLLYLPYAEVGMHLFRGLSAYSAKWEFNGSVFPLISSAIENIMPERWVVNWMIQPFGMSATPETLATRTHDMAITAAKGVVLLIFATFALYYFTRLRDDLLAEGNAWFFKLAVLLYGAFLTLNATVHPWYLCWLVPLLVVTPDRAWLLLTGLVALSYWVLIDYEKTGVWQESIVIRCLEYLPFYALLLFDALRGKYKKTTHQVDKVILEFRRS